MNYVQKCSKNSFEDIKHVDENGIEFWYARELMVALEYLKWGNFRKVIDKAKIACKQSNNKTSYHFADVGKTIMMPKGATKTIDDYQLTRYACYLIVQNSDPRKEANNTHYTVGKNIREVIAKNGGTMPEELPTPKKSLKELEKEKRIELQKLEKK